MSSSFFIYLFICLLSFFVSPTRFALFQLKFAHMYFYTSILTGKRPVQCPFLASFSTCIVAKILNPEFFWGPMYCLNGRDRCRWVPVIEWFCGYLPTTRYFCLLRSSPQIFMSLLSWPQFWRNHGAKERIMAT